jgi:hypothetical protein
VSQVFHNVVLTVVYNTYTVLAWLTVNETWVALALLNLSSLAVRSVNCPLMEAGMGEPNLYVQSIYIFCPDARSNH